MKSVWVLTSECNDYNQHGEYFEKVFPLKPSKEQLIAYNKSITNKEANHILSKGGGRIDPTEYK